MNISDPTALTNLYDWLETIPFTRPKKNFARDFSDGVLAAELVKHFFPTLVDIHNYPTSSSFEQKKVNWTVLNHKVLKKLDFPLSDFTINDLAIGSKRDATEYFLHTMRQKIDLYMKKMIEKTKKKKDSPPNSSKVTDDNFLNDPMDDSSLKESIGDSNLVGKQTAKCIKNQTIAYLKDTTLESVARDVYDKKVQELLACEETIQVLKARIQRLEITLQLKNVTIQRQQQTIEKLKTMQHCVTNCNQGTENKVTPKKLNKIARF